MRASTASRMPSMKLAKRSHRPGGSGARRDRDRAVAKPLAPMPLEIEVAREIVAARPQRLQRRGQPRFQRDIAADRRRRALLDREPHALELLVEARRVDE